jgi:hypothetical protein
MIASRSIKVSLVMKQLCSSHKHVMTAVDEVIDIGGIADVDVSFVSPTFGWLVRHL